MSITDELRKEAQGHLWYLYTSEQAKHLLAIADRIDAEHEALINSYFDGVFSDEELAENGWVCLPKDADGEYIHIGDAMEWVRYEDDDQTIVRKVSAVGAGVFFAWSDEQGRYAQYDAQAYRHHKQPTVEGVLREFVDEFNRDDTELCDEEIIERFAAKLRLAESEES